MDTPTSSRRPGRRTALGLVLLVLGTLLAFTGAGPLGGAAGALENDGLTSISGVTTPDLDTYPAGLFPADCGVTDGQILTGANYTASGPVDASNADMRQLPYLPPGTTLTVTWDAWVTGCETPVSLAVKRAVGPDFDATTDQALMAFEACGPDGVNPTVTVCGMNDDGRFTLSLVMPDSLAGCSYQTDAVIGPPLEVVGPAGSFYGSTRGDGGPIMLIGADNAGPEDSNGPGCQPPTVSIVCAAGGAKVTVTNPDVFSTIYVDVLSGATADSLAVVPDGALVQVLKAGGTADILVPFTFGQQPFIQVVDAQRNLYGPTQFTEACTGPGTPTVDVDCAAGTIIVTTVPGAPQPATFSVTATAGGADVPVTDNPDDTFTTSPHATLATTIEVSTTNIVNDPEPFFTEVVPPCTPPVADIQLECEEGVINVFTTQPTGYDVEFDVTATVAGQPVGVTDNEDGSFTVASGGEAAVVTVTADGDTIFAGTVPGCDEPAAAAAVDCETGGITVTTTQPTDHTVDFVVTANGAPLTLTNGTATTPIGAAAIRIVVTADGETILDQTVQPCDEPEADATVVCSTNDTITVTTTQPTDHTVDFVATANGTPLTLTNGTATTPIGAAAVTIVVTADGVELHRETIQPCTDVEGVQQSRQTPAQLPRTGSEDTGRLALALGLIVTGLGLLLFGEDRRLALLQQR